MNHASATYVDFIQTLGLVVIVGFTTYSIKQIFSQFQRKTEQIEKVEIRIEE